MTDFVYTVKSCGKRHSYCGVCRPDVQLKREAVRLAKSEADIDAEHEHRSEAAKKRYADPLERARLGTINRCKTLSQEQKDLISGSLQVSLAWLLDHGNKRAIKKRLLSEGLLLPVCAGCGIGQVWQERPLVLQMDHIDGDNKNNQLDNLRLLCPNCHSQTVTWAGLNRGHPFLV